jgi:hypothetical protein
MPNHIVLFGMALATNGIIKQQQLVVFLLVSVLALLFVL